MAVGVNIWHENTLTRVQAVGLSLYRVTLHPLARIPGPRTQKLSGWPRIWHCYAGDRYLREAEGHKKYGSVIRIAPNAVGTLHM